MRALTSFLDDMSEQDDFVNSLEFTNAGANKKATSAKGSALSAAELLKAMDRSRPAAPLVSNPMTYELHPLVSQVMSGAISAPRDFVSSSSSSSILADPGDDDDDDDADDPILKSLLSRSHPPKPERAPPLPPPPPDRPSGRIHAYFPSSTSDASTPRLTLAPLPAPRVSDPSSWLSSFNSLVVQPLSGALSTAAISASSAAAAAAAAASVRSSRGPASASTPASASSPPLVSSSSLGLSRLELSRLSSLPAVGGSSSSSSSSSAPAARLAAVLRRYRSVLGVIVVFVVLWAFLWGDEDGEGARLDEIAAGQSRNGGRHLRIVHTHTPRQW